MIRRHGAIGDGAGRMSARGIKHFALKRRSFLSGIMMFAMAGVAQAKILFGGQPFRPVPTPPPVPVDRAAAWQFLTDDEAAAVQAIVDRLIPPDALGAGGREAGCATFIDRQLAGPYGQSQSWYLKGPPAIGTPPQGPQFTDTIAARYRLGLAGLDQFSRQNYAGRSFAQLMNDEQDTILQGMEAGDVQLSNTDTKTFFQQLIKNTREGYFADPLYGGNQEMVGWRLVGFPGARYDYRDYIDRHDEALGLTPVSMMPRDEG